MRLPLTGPVFGVSPRPAGEAQAAGDLPDVRRQAEPGGDGRRAVGGVFRDLRQLPDAGRRAARPPTPPRPHAPAAHFRGEPEG